MMSVFKLTLTVTVMLMAEPAMIVTSNISAVYFQRPQSYAGYCFPYNMAVKTYKTSSVRACSMACAQASNCQSFSFTDPAMICAHFDMTHLQTGLINVPGCNHFHRVGKSNISCLGLYEGQSYEGHNLDNNITAYNILSAFLL